MSHATRFGAGLALGAALLFPFGCTKTNETVVVDGAPPTLPGGEHGHAHGHAAHGPHGGEIVELGSEAHHAEIVHDETAKSVTIHILDASAKAAVPIEATDVTINLTHEGEPMQFKVPASPEADDPAPLTSRFVSTDAALSEELHHAHDDAALVVLISGKQYRGKLVHDHDHEGHDHEGHDHD
ncbi:MAG TPA: hypothetical protein VGN57_23260 [Pirellulaceae bacterium]|jgi:hypothetical protein|nr:hypothetical protein [Pirellulaceae bacterium]